MRLFKFLFSWSIITILVSCTDSSELVLKNEDLKIQQQSESVISFHDLLIKDDGKSDPVLLSDENKLRLFFDTRLEANIQKYGEYFEYGVVRSTDNITYIYARFYSDNENAYITSFFDTNNHNSMAPDIDCENVHCCLLCVPQNQTCVCHNIDIPCHRETGLLMCRVVPK